MPDISVRPIASPAEMEAVMALRMAVFVDEQGVPEESEIDAHEATARHFACLLDGTIVGTARWRAVHDGELPAAKLERFAVSRQARGYGCGRALVEAVMTDARLAGFDRFILHAQRHLQDFYASQGFVAEGPVFVEDGIDHVLMRRT